jgi:hypothetical protein
MDMKRGFLFRKSFEKGIIYGHNFRWFFRMYKCT